MLQKNIFPEVNLLMNEVFVVDTYFRHNFEHVAQQESEKDGPEIREW